MGNIKAPRFHNKSQINYEKNIIREYGVSLSGNYWSSFLIFFVYICSVVGDAIIKSGGGLRYHCKSGGGLRYHYKSGGGLIYHYKSGGGLRYH